MTLKVNQMPVRGEYPNPAAYEKAMQDWQSRNTLPVEKNIAPANGTLTVLKPRQPSGHYTHLPPKP